MKTIDTSHLVKCLILTVLVAGMPLHSALAQKPLLGLTPDPGPATLKDWKISGSEVANDEFLHYMGGYVHAMVDSVDKLGIQGFCPNYEERPNPIDVSLWLDKVTSQLPESTSLLEAYSAYIRINWGWRRPEENGLCN